MPFLDSEIDEQEFKAPIQEVPPPKPVCTFRCDPVTLEATVEVVHQGDAITVALLDPDVFPGTITSAEIRQTIVGGALGVADLSVSSSPVVVPLGKLESEKTYKTASFATNVV